MYAFYLSCSSATFALQHGGFVPREWLAAEKSDEDKNENMQKTFKSLLFCYFHAAWRKLKPVFALKTLDMGYLGQESKFSS